MGDSGREETEPDYNVTGILESSVNVAIKALNITEEIDDDKILVTRERLDISGCNGRNGSFVFCGILCLFDLFDDPCETKNIVLKETQIAQELAQKLRQYWTEFVPQRNQAVDPLANPKYFNDTWYTWLETYPNLIT